MNDKTRPEMDVNEYLPLTEATFLIMLSLVQGKKHGYAIMKDVAELSDERITLGTGTLYGALARMLDQEWIERIEEEESTGRARKAYILSDLGRRILNAETERLRALTAAAQLRLVVG
ncbi:MAG: helix-turn-helix transcriptional regulator [Candidatus Promineifilaceae bacterium]